jgi:hypothetical protein
MRDNLLAQIAPGFAVHGRQAQASWDYKLGARQAGGARAARRRCSAAQRDLAGGAPAGGERTVEGDETHIET